MVMVVVIITDNINNNNNSKDHVSLVCVLDAMLRAVMLPQEMRGCGVL